MDSAYLTSPDFWQSQQSHVMVNDRDPRAVAESEMLQSWLIGRDELAGHLLFATSGSTGAAKWVVLSRKALLASAEVVNQYLEISESDTWLLVLPSFHVGGMGVLARCYQASCSLVSLEGKWNAHKYHELAVESGATFTSLVPTQLVDIVRAELSAPKNMRALVIGGGRLEDDVYKAAVALGWPIVETYGMTETASQIATTKVGSRVLEVLPSLQVKISLAGLLNVKGDTLMSGYVSCVDGQYRFQAHEGWFATSDIVELKNDALTVIGRADRCVKILGELVNLADLESSLTNTFHNLKITPPEFCIIALPDPRAGGRLVFVHEISETKSLQKALATHHKNCAPFLQIKDLFHLPQLPRSPLGKIRFAEISDLLT